MTEHLPEAAPNYGTFPRPPEGSSPCLASCGYWNTLVGAENLVRNNAEYFPEGHAKEKLTEIDLVKNALHIASKGCVGSANPTSWIACPRSALIQGMVQTAVEPSVTRHMNQNAVNTSPSTNTGQYL